MADVIIYATGMVCTSVCADANLTPEEVEYEVNTQSPTGISSQWTISEHQFATGQPNPCQCDKDPQRKHYLLTC